MTKLMAVIVVGLGLLGFSYTFLKPATVKASNEANYKKMGFGEKPIWFWRMLGAIGSIGSIWVLLQLLPKSN